DLDIETTGLVDVPGQKLDLLVAGSERDTAFVESSDWVLRTVTPGLSLSSAERQFQPGDTIPASQIRELRFGIEGKVKEFAFVADVTNAASQASPSPRKLRVQIKPEIDTCDALGGEPLDLQSPVQGIDAFNLNLEATLEACRASVQRFPQMARFRFQLARALLGLGKVSDAQVELRIAHALGHARASFYLGYAALTGAGEKADLKKAAQYFKSAASFGDPYGLHSYGKSLVYGRGVKPDVKAGLVYLNRAASLGHSFALNEMGVLFTQGRAGVPRDVSRGMKFYALALERDDVYALYNMGHVYLSGEGLPARSSEKAVALFKLAADRGHPLAPNELGRAYFLGTGVPKDIEAAQTWFRLGVSRGDAWAATNLAQLTNEGAFGSPDKVEAAKLLAIAVALQRPSGSAEAKALLKKAAKKDKIEALKALSTEGEGASLPSSGIDEALVAAARATVRDMKFRFDLF
ncbi:MAG: tetratricopeptide repeat protein, partial [Labrys sp. (in: a-proteobacteria)]